MRAPGSGCPGTGGRPASRSRHAQPRPIDFPLHARSPGPSPSTLSHHAQRHLPHRCDPGLVICDSSLCHSPEVLTLTPSTLPCPCCPPPAPQCYKSPLSFQRHGDIPLLPNPPHALSLSSHQQESASAGVHRAGHHSLSRTPQINPLSLLGLHTPSAPDPYAGAALRSRHGARPSPWLPSSSSPCLPLLVL